MHAKAEIKVGTSTYLGPEAAPAPFAMGFAREPLLARPEVLLQAVGKRFHLSQDISNRLDACFFLGD